MSLPEATFLDELASAAPTPGGGGASAYVGALAAALASMVGNLTVANKRYAEVHESMQSLLEQLSQRRADLYRLIELDARAFAPISAAFKMPDDTPDHIAQRQLALQSALVQGCEIPLDIMRECKEVLDACKVLAREGSRMALSDVGVAAVFSKAAIQGAALNIYVNAGWMTDQHLAVHYVSQAHQISSEAECLADELYAYVQEYVEAGS